MFSWVLLRQSSKSQTVEVFKLNAGINNIGRKKNNNIVVSSKYTSGSHCEIFVSDERIELTDRVRIIFYRSIFTEVTFHII